MSSRGPRRRTVSPVAGTSKSLDRQRVCVSTPPATATGGGTLRFADGKDAEVLWRVIINRLRTTASFRQLAQREIPIFVLEPYA